MSAIRTVLAEDGFKLCSDNFTISSLTRACKIRNDRIVVKLPIHKNLLTLLLKEITSWMNETGQSYLKILYLALFAATYYGLLRIGEVMHSPHCILAENVHMGVNKKKLLFILPSSKTHNRCDNPQTIRICSTPVKCIDGKDDRKTKVRENRQSSTNKFCPFELINNYTGIRPAISTPCEKFFVFSDGSSVYPHHMRSVLKLLIARLGLNQDNYTVHGLCGGQAGDLLRLGVSVETIKKMGHWRSNAVFRYLKDCC